MRPRMKRRCDKPNIWHLLLILSLCLCVILLSIYYLNAHAGERIYRGAIPASLEQDFKADFRALPISLPGHRRVVVLVASHWDNSDRRFTIRNTWATNQHRFNCSTFFVVGDSDDSDISRVAHEAAFFADIIQPAVWDSKLNKVLKLLAAFRFAESALHADFVMVTNDDVFVNLPEITSFLKNYPSPNEKLIFGTTEPYNDELRFLLPEPWPKNVPIPDYVFGSSYIISSDVMKRFVLCPKFANLLPEDHLYFTGVCRQYFGLQLQHVDNFSSKSRHKAPCLWRTKFITSGVNAKEMDSIWTMVNKKNVPRC